MFCSLGQADLPKMTQFSTQCQIITFVIHQYGKPRSYGKPLKYMEAVKFTGANTHFPKFSFFLKAQIYLWQEILANVFPEVPGSLCSFFRNHLPKVQAWITMVCLSLIISDKNDAPGKRRQFSSQLKQSHKCFPSRQPLYFLQLQGCFIHMFVTQNIKRCVFRVKI